MGAAVVDRLRVFPLFAHAEAETLRAVAAATTAHVYPHGETIWRAGDTPGVVFFLSRGLVEIVRVTADGTEAALALFGPRECPGLFATIDGKKFPASARVLSEDVELFQVERAALLHAIDHDPNVTRDLAVVLRQHHAVLREKVEVITAGEVPQRLATLFLTLAERFGDERESGELIIPITLTRRVLARLVGARVETVIRVLSRWQKEAFVRVHDEGGFVVEGVARLRREAQRAP